jgi:Uma2 family endonuclease
MEPAVKRATYADLVTLPDDVRAEIHAGEVVVSPSPTPRHAKAQGAMRRFVGGPYDDDDGHGGPGGWWILLEVDVRFEVNEIVRPDLSGWRRERLDDPWDKRPIDVVPDWVCEVLSQSNAATDRVRKRQLYARHGVTHYWIVDPMARTLEAMTLQDGAWLEVGSYTDGSVAHIEPFHEIELDIARLFPPP